MFLNMRTVILPKFAHNDQDFSPLEKQSSILEQIRQHRSSEVDSDRGKLCIPNLLEGKLLFN